MTDFVQGLPTDILNHEIIPLLDDKSIIKVGMLNRRIRKMIRKPFQRSRDVRATLTGTFRRDLEILDKLRFYGRISLDTPYFQYRYETFHVFVFCSCRNPELYLLIHYCPCTLMWRMYVGSIDVLVGEFSVLLDENISIIEKNRECRELIKGNINVFWKLNTFDKEMFRKIKKGYGKWFGKIDASYYL